MAKPKAARDPALTQTVLDQNGAEFDDVMPGMLVEIPHLAELPESSYRPTHVEARLDPPQAEALARLFQTLDEGGLRLKSGRRVTSSADAVRWLLEAVGEATPIGQLEEEKDE